METKTRSGLPLLMPSPLGPSVSTVVSDVHHQKTSVYECTSNVCCEHR